jgi:hypothetical protein
MPMTHYPKNSENLVFAWVQPPPPDIKPQKGLPDFLGRPFSEMNRFEQPIGPGESVVGYHDAQPFTRFYGTIYCTQPLEVSLVFSNDEIAADGRVVSDGNIDKLHYDGEALRQFYDPQKQGPTGKFFVTIYGRFIRVEIKNTGDAPTKELRCYVRGSVF